MGNIVEGNKVLQMLDTLYEKCLNGIPKISIPVSELADEYIKKYGRTDKAIDKLVRNQISKNSLNGFATSFGGLSTMLVTLPANITSVLYVQMRMIASIALIRGYDLKDDEVQTFVYSCLVGLTLADTFKSAGVQVGNKMALNAVKKLPGNIITKINQAIGFRFITKGGTKGTIQLTKAVPVVGTGVGATIDFSTTWIIAKRAKKVFEGNNIINLV
ncbi:EcsC family protein [Listeria monocytogenes]|nr:EcsC family protein [Listeria monocytogenes]